MACDRRECVRDWGEGDLEAGVEADGVVLKLRFRGL